MEKSDQKGGKGKKKQRKPNNKQDAAQKKFNKLIEQVEQYPALKQIIYLKKKIELSRKERRRTSNKLIKLKTGYV